VQRSTIGPEAPTAAAVEDDGSVASENDSEGDDDVGDDSSGDAVSRNVMPNAAISALRCLFASCFTPCPPVAVWSSGVETKQKNGGPRHSGLLAADREGTELRSPASVLVPFQRAARLFVVVPLLRLCSV
jgi:hypothetical protein